MDYDVVKLKKQVKKPEPEHAPKSAPPAQPSLPPSSYQGPIPFMERGYGEDFDRMSRIPGMRDFQVIYSKTYRWNVMDDSMEDDYNYNNNHRQPIMSNRGMQRFPPPPPPRRTIGPSPEYGPPGMILAPPSHFGYDDNYNYSWPPPPRRTIGPPPEYGPPGMIPPPPSHFGYDDNYNYSWLPPLPPPPNYYGLYGGGRRGYGGYYDHQRPGDCRVM